MAALVVVTSFLLAACGTVNVADESSETGHNENETELASLAPTAIPIGRSPTPEPTPTPLPTATSTPTWQVDVAAVDALLNPEDGVYGVVLLSDNGDVLYSRNSTTPFITASVYKLLVLADVLKRVEDGEVSLDDDMVLESDIFPAEGEESDTYFSPEEAGNSYSVRELLYAMGAYSSNVAARTLLTLTTPESMTETAHDIGMEDTYVLTPLGEIPNWPPEPSADAPDGNTADAVEFIESLSVTDEIVNLSTPRDMATYLYGLIEGTTVSPYVSEQIVSILKQNRIEDRIPYLLEDRYEIANKPGNLNHVTNDVGIIYTENGPRVVVGLTEGTTWDGRAREAIARLALFATGSSEVPAIPPESMEEGTAPLTDWGSPDDPSTVIADPPEEPNG